MSKQKAAKQQQLLSPEKYICQKSRNLPIVSCMINEKWKENGEADIAIVRQHAGGNLTICLYLVDLQCLGLKDTSYFFNISPFIWEEKFAKFNESMKHIDVPYDLVHNIIYAAIEYAESYGFTPHPDFDRITSFFLEEDTDDIPLIHIECGGKDGNPLYVYTGYETPARAKQILNHLKATAGEGNYNYILDESLADYKDE
ncbi:MAG: hypothetical protein LBH32_09500 [Dysgonamonadaceae bacterium]|jgi:hypothetical protein|nr:hypothetical protein [Dysgonamonadaceae bacterium]